MSSVYVVMYDDISNSLIYDCILLCLITFLGASVLRLRSQDGMVVWYGTIPAGIVPYSLWYWYHHIVW